MSESSRSRILWTFATKQVERLPHLFSSEHPVTEQQKRLTYSEIARHDSQINTRSWRHTKVQPTTTGVYGCVGEFGSSGLLCFASELPPGLGRNKRSERSLCRASKLVGVVTFHP